MSENLSREINDLWACLIEDIQHDYRKARLLICIKEPENETLHTLQFNNVKSILWTMVINEDEDIEKNFFPELTSLVLRDIVLKTKDKWLKNYPKKFNVCIEIMDRALLVEATEIMIDGHKYGI